MLERLSIENYALIQQLELELSPSLNIITGETGAGKSILLGALGLIMGNRADTAVLKDSGRNCVIEGLFDMGGYGLETFFDENELDYERHTVIRRIVTPAGKSRAYVNDLPVQLATLRELAAHLIDIHSQNQGVLVADGEFREDLLYRINTIHIDLPIAAACGPNTAGRTVPCVNGSRSWRVCAKRSGGTAVTRSICGSSGSR